MPSSLRSSPAPAGGELRMPRPPGVIRQFWARHPRLTDILVVLLATLLSLPPVLGTGGGVAPVPVWLAVLGGCLALILRRRLPLTAFAVATAASLAYLFAALPSGGLLLLFAGYAVAVYRSSSAAWWCLALGVGALTVVSGAALALSVTTFVLAANLIVGSLIAGLVGTLIGVNIGNRKRYLEAVIDRSHQLWVEREQHAQLAASAERARIAREMHDIVSHSLTVIVALSEGAGATSDTERARAATAQISSTAREALREMRAMLGVLREDDAEVPLHSFDDNAVAPTIERAQRAGFPVVFQQRGPLDHPRPIRLAIARIVQEGITNAMRHAPGATRIDVIVDTDKDAVTVEVRNNGAIHPVGTDGFGIRGLHERIEHVGGTLNIGPLAPDIWLLVARLPLATAAVPRDERAHAATKGTAA